MRPEDRELLEQIIEQAVRFAIETSPLPRLPQIVRQEIVEQLHRNNLVIGKLHQLPPYTDDDN